MRTKKTRRDDVIYINLSTPFLERTRCKFCGSFPVQYYYIRKHSSGSFYKSDRYLSWLRSHKYTMSSDDYEYMDIDEINAGDFSHNIPNNSYNPVASHTRGISAKFDVQEYVVCECGKSCWSFYYKTAQNRPEIINRKCRNHHYKPFKF